MSEERREEERYVLRRRVGDQNAAHFDLREGEGGDGADFGILGRHVGKPLHLRGRLQVGCGEQAIQLEI